jgi:hypothetical protein
VEGGEKVAVCKIMFINMAGVTETFVRVALKNKLYSGLVSTEQRKTYTFKQSARGNKTISCVTYKVFSLL